MYILRAFKFLSSNCPSVRSSYLPRARSIQQRATTSRKSARPVFESGVQGLRYQKIMESENSAVDAKLLSQGEKARTVRTIPLQTKLGIVLLKNSRSSEASRFFRICYQGDRTSNGHMTCCTDRGCGFRVVWAKRLRRNKVRETRDKVCVRRRVRGRCLRSCV